MKGLFITFEGPDGAGKSTQIQKLADYLRNKGTSFVMTREPGGTKIGDSIREILLNPAHSTLNDKTEVLLYAASRAQHVTEVILPALEEGKIVLCDRFVDASIAYQGYGLDLSLKMVQEINDFAVNGLIPDRTYLIDLPPDAGRLRMTNREAASGGGKLDRIEQKNLDYHRKVREGFYHIHHESKQRICMINGAGSVEEVFRDILEDFDRVLKNTIDKRGV